MMAREMRPEWPKSARYLSRPAETQSGSIGRLGEPGIFGLRFCGEAALANDQRAIDPGVLVGVGAVALGSGSGARCPRSGTWLVGVLTRAIPGIVRGPEGGIRGEARLRGHRAAGGRQRQQENGGRFDHDATLCTRIRTEVAPIMFKIP